MESHRLRRCVHRLVHAGIALPVALLTLILMGQVFFRYALNSSLYWGEELARYILVTMTFLGSLLLLRRGTLTTIVLGKPSPGTGFMHRLLRHAPTLLFHCLLAWSAFALISRTGSQRSIALGLPMCAVYAPILICGTVGALIVLMKILRLQPPR
jgi:TRAP-type C4-dicarboxylate transport system permease small subunit